MTTSIKQLDKYGTIYWLFHCQYHREDGPAIEFANGDKEWYINGQLHREDGPAVESSNRYKEWFIHGKRHREDGPAIEFANGIKEWWFNGHFIKCDNQKDFLIQIKNMEALKIAQQYL